MHLGFENEWSVQLQKLLGFQCLLDIVSAAELSVSLWQASSNHKRVQKLLSRARQLQTLSCTDERDMRNTIPTQ